MESYKRKWVTGVSLEVFIAGLSFLSSRCFLTQNVMWPEHSKTKKNIYVSGECINAIPQSIPQYFYLECVYSLKVCLGLWTTSAMSNGWNSFLGSTTRGIIRLKIDLIGLEVKSKLMKSWRKSQYFATFLQNSTESLKKGALGRKSHLFRTSWPQVIHSYH